VDDPDERAALTSVCRELPHLLAERPNVPADQQALIDRIRAEAAARRPILPLLTRLVGARRAGFGLPGVGPGSPDEERFVCPDDACDLTEVPEPGGAIPRCHATGRPMKRA
jgi:hypothetical protein